MVQCRCMCHPFSLNNEKIYHLRQSVVPLLNQQKLEAPLHSHHNQIHYCITSTTPLYHCITTIIRYCITSKNQMHNCITNKNQLYYCLTSKTQILHSITRRGGNEQLQENKFYWEWIWWITSTTPLYHCINSKNQMHHCITNKNQL